jgi:hypothetical protein
MARLWIWSFLFISALAAQPTIATDWAECELDEDCWDNAAQAEHQVLVKLKDPLKEFPSMFAGLTLVATKCRVVSADRNTYLFVVRSALSTQSVVDTLEKDRRVIFAQPNHPYKP